MKWWTPIRFSGWDMLLIEAIDEHKKSLIRHVQALFFGELRMVSARVLREDDVSTPQEGYLQLTLLLTL